MKYVLMLFILFLVSCKSEEELPKSTEKNSDTTVVVGSKRDTRKEREILALLANVPKEKLAAVLHQALADPAFSESKYLASLCDIQANAPAALRATKLAKVLKRGKMIDAMGRDFYKAWQNLSVDRATMHEVLEKDGRFSPITSRVNYYGALMSGTYMSEMRENRGSQAYALIARLLQEARLYPPANALEVAEVIVTDTGWINEFSIIEEHRVELLKRVVKRAKRERDSIYALLDTYANSPGVSIENDSKKAVSDESELPLYFYFGTSWQDTITAAAVVEVQNAVREAGFSSFSYDNHSGDWYDGLPAIEVTPLDAYDLVLKCGLSTIELKPIADGEILFTDSLETDMYNNNLLQSASEGKERLLSLCKGKSVKITVDQVLDSRRLLSICSTLQRGEVSFRLELEK